MTLLAPRPTVLDSPLPAPETTRSHRADIDGLRAVAVLLVLLYHVGLGFPGGYVGVDVFLVISGYLIAGIIRRDLEAGTFSLAGFWLRRVRRIAPASLVMTAATLVAGVYLLLPKQLMWVAESAIAHQLLAANVYFSLKGGYFDGAAELRPLLHTWSLAVEEQFYLVFPLVLFACRRHSRYATACLLGLVALASLLVCVTLAGRAPLANFYWPPSRTWELLLGAILAVHPLSTRRGDRVREGIGLVGLGAILASSWLYGASTPFPGLAALPPTLGAAALLYSGTLGAGLATRVLSWRPLVTLGAASYSVYLWHWPLLVYLKHEQGRALPLGVRLVVVVVSLGVGFASWRLVEEPVRRRRVLGQDRMLVAAYMATTLALFVASWFLVREGGLPGRFSSRAALIADAEEPARWAEAAAAPTRVFTRFGATTGRVRPDFLLWGDSHAEHIGRLVERLSVERGLRGVYSWRGASTPLVGVYTTPEDRDDKLAWNREVVDQVVAKRIPAVILAARWEVKLAAGSPEPLLLKDERTRGPSPEDARRVLDEGLRRTLARLEATGTRVYFVSQVPVQDEGQLARLIKGVDPRAMRGTTRAEYRRQQRAVTDALGRIRSPGLTIVGPSVSWFDGDGASRLTADGRLLYKDESHLTERGAEFYYRPLLEPVFDEIAGPHR